MSTRLHTTPPTERPGSCHRAPHTVARRLRLLPLCLLLLCLTAACQYSNPVCQELPQKSQDSLQHLYQRHYTWGTNLELAKDSIALECLPLKDTYIHLRKGDRVVVAEFAVHPADSIDTLWVKLAHTQREQGWLREQELKQFFVPTDSISQAIYFFSHTHAPYFVAAIALCVGLYLLRTFRKNLLQPLFFNGIDSTYPLFLCLLMAFSATVYETMQVFAPQTWEHFYFNPTLSPFRVPPILSAFLLSLWLFLVVGLAVLEAIFHRLSPAAAFFYLLGLMTCCIFCYFFFILTTHIYVGYLFLACFVWFFAKKLHQNAGYKYSCGACGTKLRSKGVCPRCKAVNK